LQTTNPAIFYMCCCEIVALWESFPCLLPHITPCYDLFIGGGMPSWVDVQFFPNRWKKRTKKDLEKIITGLCPQALFVTWRPE
jgi:hypothetical protein